MSIKGPDGEQYEEIFVDVIHETELAVLARVGDQQEWFPKSQLEDWPDVGDSGLMMARQWILEEKGFV